MSYISKFENPPISWSTSLDFCPHCGMYLNIKIFSNIDEKDLISYLIESFKNHSLSDCYFRDKFEKVRIVIKAKYSNDVGNLFFYKSNDCKVIL